MSEPLIDLRLGDCVEVMQALDNESISAVVTDPPYGIGFMGKAWDGRAIEEAMANPRDVSTETRLTGGADGGPRKLISRTASAYQTKAGEAGSYDFTPKGMQAFQQWTQEWASEALRVLKPGAHLVVFGGTRTYHRMVCGIEDAGFEIRDQLAWMFGSGFPKSLDVSKAIDAALLHGGSNSARIKIANDESRTGGERVRTSTTRNDGIMGELLPAGRIIRDEPVTEDAIRWQGWGTALKPGYEPIVLARKPFTGPVAQNVLTHGTGALNIDGTRIGTEERFNPPAGNKPGGASLNMSEYGMPDDAEGTTASGRWPANVILDQKAAELLDEQSGELVSGNRSAGAYTSGGNVYGTYAVNERPEITGDIGGASRFFYVPKVDPSERHAGLAVPSLFVTDAPDKNTHPTVKPIDLMRWLIRLVTPPGGIVLDPFMGSGTTGCAASLENFGFIGIERESEYMRIAEGRIAHWASRLVSAT